MNYFNHPSGPTEKKTQQKQTNFLAKNHKLIAHLPLQASSPQYKNSHKPNSPLLITGKVKRHSQKIKI